MSAVRLARGRHGPRPGVKFDGCYHGHSDALLAGGGSGVATLGPSGLGRGARRGRGRHRGRALQRGARARRARGLRDRRAGGGQHGPGRPAPGFLEGLRAGLRRRRRAPDLRRGHHRLPARRRRGHRVVGVARPVVLRQGHRRRAARWAPSADAARCWLCWPRAAPCTRRARCRGTRWPPRPGWPCWSGGAGGLRGAGRPGRRLRRRPRGGRGSGGLAATVAGDRAAGRSVRGPRSGPAVAPSDYESAHGLAGTAYARFFHAMLRRGVALAPGPYEAMFPGLATTSACCPGSST